MGGPYLMCGSPTSNEYMVLVRSITRPCTLCYSHTHASCLTEHAAATIPDGDALLTWRSRHVMTSFQLI
jgi:hypothetical protein